MKKFTVLCNIYGDIGCRDAFAILEIRKKDAELILRLMDEAKGLKEKYGEELKIMGGYLTKDVVFFSDDDREDPDDDPRFSAEKEIIVDCVETHIGADEFFVRGFLQDTYIDAVGISREELEVV